MRSLKLSLEQLREIRTEVARQILDGLPRRDGLIRALPTFLPPPPEDLAGRAAAVDFGGTSLRAAVVRLDANRNYEIEAGPRSRRLDSRKPDEDLFSWQAGALEGLTGDELPLGYCFSYPARVLPDGDAVLLGWTKEIDYPEAVGKRVGKLLRNAVRNRGGKISGAVVLNDTVAALLGGSWKWGEAGGRDSFIGMVVGTGFNLAAFFPVSTLGEKTAGWDRESRVMAVNLEAGNLYPPHLSPWDDELDAGRPDAGRQRMEKAVSGKYLPELAAFILGKDLCPEIPLLTDLGRWAEEYRDRRGETARRLLERAGGLAAAALAGLGDALGLEGEIRVIAEGSVINKSQFYRRETLTNLDRLTAGEGERSLRLLKLDDANLVGAAAAALL